MDSQTPPQMNTSPMSSPTKSGNNVALILVVLVALALIAFFAMSKKQPSTTDIQQDPTSTLDAGAQVELSSTSTSVKAIDEDYKSADPSNLDAGI